MPKFVLAQQMAQDRLYFRICKLAPGTGMLAVAPGHIVEVGSCVPRRDSNRYVQGGRTHPRALILCA